MTGDSLLRDITAQKSATESRCLAELVRNLATVELNEGRAESVCAC